MAADNLQIHVYDSLLINVVIVWSLSFITCFLVVRPTDHCMDHLLIKVVIFWLQSSETCFLTLQPTDPCTDHLLINTIFWSLSSEACILTLQHIVPCIHHLLINVIFWSPSSKACLLTLECTDPCRHFSLKFVMKHKLTEVQLSMRWFSQIWLQTKCKGRKIYGPFWLQPTEFWCRIRPKKGLNLMIGNAGNFR